MASKGQVGNPTGKGGFKKGDPRINRAGQPQKARIAKEIMEEMGFEPVSAMVMLVKDPKTGTKTRADAIAWLGDKIYPSMKSIEHKGDGEAPVVIRFNLPPDVKK